MTGRDAIGVFNLVIIAAILGGISYLAFVVRPAEYDPDTLCLADTVPPHRVVVVDKTDLYSSSQAGAIAGAIIAQRDLLAVGERLSLFELNERGNLADTNSFSLCNPGSGEQVNPLYRNPTRIQARYEAAFAEPLSDALDDLMTPKDAPQSPILEALARLSTERGFTPDVPGRRVVLVSDMLQNSDLFTVYGRGRGTLDERLPDAADVADALEAEFGDGLRGVVIEILLVERDGWQDNQAGPLRRYWADVFRALGVRVRWGELPGDGAYAS